MYLLKIIFYNRTQSNFRQLESNLRAIFFKITPALIDLSQFNVKCIKDEIIFHLARNFFSMHNIAHS